MKFFFYSILFWGLLSATSIAQTTTDTTWMNAQGRIVDGPGMATQCLIQHWEGEKHISQWIQYYPVRRMLMDFVFDSDTYTGYEKIWYPNGQLHAKRTLFCPDKDWLNAKWLYAFCYDSLGNELMQSGNGTFAAWHPNGQKHIEMKVAHGRIDGPVSVWNPAGEAIPVEMMFVAIGLESYPLSHFLTDVQPEMQNLDAIKQAIGYPAIARDAGIMGLVVTRVQVDTAGNVVNIQLNKSAATVLDEAVIQQVKNLRFSPAIFNGQKISFWVNVPFRFTLLDSMPQPPRKSKKKKP